MSSINRAYLATVFDDPEELEAIVAEGIADLRRSLSELDAKARENEPNGIREIAHRMKGVAAQLGAKSIQSAASALEEATARDPAPGGAEPQRYAALISALRAAVAAL